MTAGTPDEDLPKEKVPAQRPKQGALEDDAEAEGLEIGLDGLIQAPGEETADDVGLDDDGASAELDIGAEIDALADGEGDEEGPEELELAGLLSPLDALSTTEDDAEGPDEAFSLREPDKLLEVEDDGTGPSEASDEPLQPLEPLDPLDEIGTDESGEGPLGEDEQWPRSEREDIRDEDEDEDEGENDEEGSDEGGSDEEGSDEDEEDATRALESVPVFLSFRPPIPERLWEQVCVFDVPETTECMTHGPQGFVIAGAGIDLIHPHRESLPAPPGYVTRLARDLCIASSRLFHLGSNDQWHEIELPTEQPPLEIWVGSGAWLALCADGTLLRSNDRGANWRRPLDEHLRCLSRGDALLALSAPPENRLLQSVDAGATWEPLGVAPPTCHETGQPGAERGRNDATAAISRAYSTAPAPQLESSGSLILLAEASAGIAVSTDRGLSLVQLDGTFEVSAATCAEIQRTPAAFAAMPSTRSLGSDIIQIGPTAELQECIAHAGPTPSGEEDRVRALDFDPGTELLWALMDSRVVAWRPRTN